MHPSFEIWHKIMKNDMHIAAGVEFCMLASADLILKLNTSGLVNRKFLP